MTQERKKTKNRLVRVHPGSFYTDSESANDEVIVVRVHDYSYGIVLTQMNKEQYSLVYLPDFKKVVYVEDGCLEPV